MILDRLLLVPKYRGRGNGLLVLRELIRCLGMGAGLMAMKPFPLQKEVYVKGLSSEAERKRFELDKLALNGRLATATLRRYYRRLGFIKVPATDFMVLDAGRVLISKERLLDAK